MRKPTKTALAIVAGAVMLVMASSATTAVATRLITGADVADQSLTGDDIQKGSIQANRIKPGSIGLRHLDRDSIRAGHVHSHEDPVVIGKAGGKASNRDGYGFTTLNNGVNTKVGSVSSLPPGSYLMIATGQMGLGPVSYNGKYYQNAGSCTIGSSNTTATVQSYSAPSPYNVWYYSTVAMSRIVTLTTTADLLVMCKAIVSTPSPPTGMVGFADIDLVAIPVTSYVSG